MPKLRRRWRQRDIALFLAVAGLVALLTVLIGRELGIGRPAEATKPVGETAQELTLSLTTLPTCETRRAFGLSGSEWIRDDDGVIIGTRRVSLGYSVAEVAVQWLISGGTPPYTITIDNETRDIRGTYKGSNVTALVSCAHRTGEVIYDDIVKERRLVEDPQIDSGPKVISGTVTDANGNMATGSTRTYVILRVDAAQPLNAGRTYSIGGILVTIPHNVIAEYADLTHIECYNTDPDCEDQHIIHTLGIGYRGELGIGAHSGTAAGTHVRIGNIWGIHDTTASPGSDHDSIMAAVPDEEKIQAALDLMSDSVGDMPAGTTGP